MSLYISYYHCIDASLHLFFQCVCVSMVRECLIGINYFMTFPPLDECVLSDVHTSDPKTRYRVNQLHEITVWGGLHGELEHSTYELERQNKSRTFYPQALVAFCKLGHFVYPISRSRLKVNGDS